MDKENSRKKDKLLSAREAFDTIVSYGYGKVKESQESESYKKKLETLKKVCTRLSAERINSLIGNIRTELELDDDKTRNMQKVAIGMLFSARKLKEAEELRKISKTSGRDIEDVALDSVENLVKSGYVKEAYIVAGYADGSKVKVRVVNGAAHLIGNGRTKDAETAALAFDKFGMPRTGREGTDALSTGLMALARNTHINHESKMNIVAFTLQTFGPEEDDRKRISLDIVEYFINAGSVGSASSSVPKLGITKDDLVGLLEKMKRKEINGPMLRKD
ncbi:MAG: hypothetical protein KGI06_02180 [Candidatus Micrarchaeota archaeon]|nr:hypothetical protein [Candidatus Micrarchaeota archaeon]